VQVAVLGPLEVRTDDLAPVPVPGARERLLLAVLVARAPGAVGVAELVEALWDGAPPAAPGEALHACVVRLRAHLEPGLPPNASGRYVLRRGPGYALALARGDVDALRAGTLLARGSAALAAGDPAEADRLLSTALRLWRGEPYADWPDAAFSRPERARLAALRADAEAGLAEARRRLAERAINRPPRTVLPPRAVPVPSFRAPGPAVAAGGSDRPIEVHLADGAPETRPAQVPVAPRGRRPLGVLVVAGIVVLTLAAAGLAVRSQRQAQDAAAAAEEAATVAEAQRLAARTTSGPLDLSLLLAVQAVRLADTAETRERLATLLSEHPRAQRIGRFTGIPQDPMLTGPTPTLVVGADDEVIAWQLGAEVTQPRAILDIPGEWGSWRTAFPSPVESAVVGAGVADRGLWLRSVSAADGSTRVLVADHDIAGVPVAGAVAPDGRTFLLLVAEPDAAPLTARWRVIEVDEAAATLRDTGTSGTFPAPPDSLRADFASDAGSFVLWAEGGWVAGGDTAVRVDLGGSQTPLQVSSRSSRSPALRVLPSGAAQLWTDGVITVLDGGGAPIQELGAHPGQVYDLEVSPDGTWAVSAGAAGAVLWWTVDPVTGRWSERGRLPGHVGGVIGVETDPTGHTVVTVGLDNTAISWDLGAVVAPALPATDPAALVRRACAIVGRDFSPREWLRYLPDRPYGVTCTDLS
jgi:hypothetical protein